MENCYSISPPAHQKYNIRCGSLGEYFSEVGTLRRLDNISWFVEGVVSYPVNVSCCLRRVDIQYIKLSPVATVAKGMIPAAKKHQPHTSAPQNLDKDYTLPK